MTGLLARWLILLALLGVTCGLAFVPLGAAAMPVALVIAFAMASIVLLACMRLHSAPGLAAIFAVAAICWVLVLLTLGGVDYGTRTILPVAGAIHPDQRR